MIMTKRHIFLALLAGVLFMSMPAYADEQLTNLVKNGSFEEYTPQNANFLSEGDYANFKDWEREGFCTRAETTDVYDGKTALRLYYTSANNIYQRVENLTDDYYEAGTPFRLTLHFKALTIPTNGTVSIECYWEGAAGSDVEAIKAVDADKLQRIISDSVQDKWHTLIVETKRPAKAKDFYICLKVSAKAVVLFDSIAFSALPTVTPEEPVITVTPESVPSVSCKVGETATFQTIHLSHANVQAPTTFRIGGSNSDQFELSANELPKGQSEIDITVTYKPKQAGTHSALLIFDNPAHTAILPDMISLKASCTDPTKKPTITVTPATLLEFETRAGKQISKTITIKSENCTDYVYLKIEHIQGEAFTCGSSMLPKNFESEATIYFTPLEIGTYQSKLIVSTQGGESVELTLNGNALESTPETIDWTTDFQWNDSNPYALLDETFDSAEYNETLKIKDWQNVADANARPWWGFDEAKTTPKRGNGKYAKATAYQYGKDSTDTWEMWLVTPALDYAKAEHKLFKFSVMGEYMPENGSTTALEVYYIDATDSKNIFFQKFEGLSIPSTADENNIWVPFEIHLEDQPNISVFHMAFRYIGPNGGMGSVTYYIDDVSWGKESSTPIDPGTDPGDQAIENTYSIGKDLPEASKILHNGTFYILRGNKVYSVSGQEVRTL